MYAIGPITLDVLQRKKSIIIQLLRHHIHMKYKRFNLLLNQQRVPQPQPKIGGSLLLQMQ